MWRNMLRRSLLALAALNPLALLLAQNPVRGIKFERLGLEQGLSQSTVYRILQDRQGFMWFGTQAGLYKFDGYNFTVYKHNVLDSTSLSTNGVLSIYEDRAGTLWVGVSGGGLNRFDREKEQFKRFVYNPQNPYSLRLCAKITWNFVQPIIFLMQLILHSTRNLLDKSYSSNSARLDVF